jgi:hypothetical protein
MLTFVALDVFFYNVYNIHYGKQIIIENKNGVTVECLGALRHRKAY